MRNGSVAQPRRTASARRVVRRDPSKPRRSRRRPHPCGLGLSQSGRRCFHSNAARRAGLKTARVTGGIHDVPMETARVTSKILRPFDRREPLTPSGIRSRRRSGGVADPAPSVAPTQDACTRSYPSRAGSCVGGIQLRERREKPPGTVHTFHGLPTNWWSQHSIRCTRLHRTWHREDQ
jgi:hypothetical protein